MEYDELREIRDRTRLIIEDLMNLGIRVPKGSRLRRYLSALDKTVAAQGVPRDAKIDVALLHHLLAEVKDFGEILGAVAQPPIGQALTRLITVALSGNPLRVDDNNSAARDAQFELVVAAALQRSGHQVHFGEPDLHCHHSDGREFVVAVKRVRSVSKLQTRLREAAAQIANSARDGIIVLDVSCVLNPRDKPLVANSPMTAQDYVDKLLKDHVAETTERLLRSGPRRFVFGLVFHVSVPIIIRPVTLAYERLWATVNVLPFDNPKTLQLRRILNGVPLWR